MRAIFLDRDGVLNENRDTYVRSTEQLRLLPGVTSAVRTLAGTPFKVVVITNQAGVGRGLFSQQALDAIHDHLTSQMERAGGRLDAIFACTHARWDHCDCRKPRPGLLFRAAAQLDLDLSGSFFIGDALTDVAAGLAAGCRPILVRTGLGAQMALQPGCPPGLTIVDDLASAVQTIQRFEAVRATTPYFLGKNANAEPKGV